MNFNFYLLKSFRIFLFLFSVIYGLIVIFRNYLFDKNVFKSVTFNMPLVCVGNLSMGGTGKSPMVEYIIRLLQDNYRVATLSRGYKRKTKGYALANASTTALDIGDEPMQFHAKFPAVSVAVGEERIVAIPQLLHDKPDTQVIILDDAFQHRRIKAGLNIILTECNNLFTRDFFLPTGDLRDSRMSYKRADIIVVTKCPGDLSLRDKAALTDEIEPLDHQQIFFTSIEYETPYHIITRQTREITQEDEIMLVCGIANPRPIKAYLLEHAKTYYEHLYADHHIFRIDDLEEINAWFKQIEAEQKIILTTEKDAVRLMKFQQELLHLPVYVLPVRHCFLFEEGSRFNETITSFINKYNINRNNNEQEKQ